MPQSTPASRLHLGTRPHTARRQTFRQVSSSYQNSSLISNRLNISELFQNARRLIHVPASATNPSSRNFSTSVNYSAQSRTAAVHNSWFSSVPQQQTQLQNNNKIRLDFYNQSVTLALWKQKLQYSQKPVGNVAERVSLAFKIIMESVEFVMENL